MLNTTKRKGSERKAVWITASTICWKLMTLSLAHFIEIINRQCTAASPHHFEMASLLALQKEKRGILAWILYFYNCKFD